jgi:hypothetical protein
VVDRAVVVERGRVKLGCPAVELKQRLENG